jgi:hypothetical protein
MRPWISVAALRAVTRTVQADLRSVPVIRCCPLITGGGSIFCFRRRSIHPVVEHLELPFWISDDDAVFPVDKRAE